MVSSGLRVMKVAVTMMTSNEGWYNGEHKMGVRGGVPGVRDREGVE